MRSKTLKELVTGLPVTLSQSLAKLRVNAVHYDSRKIKKGGLFVAVRGFRVDGHNYLKAVMDAGAACAIVEKEDTGIGLPQIAVQDTRKALAVAAANFYRPEIDRLRLLGVTGTNGKTSVSFLLRSILQAAGSDSGVIGTIAYYYAGKEIPAWNTTPEAPDICRILFELTVQRQQACVLEVSSHALSLSRVHGLQFDGAVFTNLSRDHLDFHKTEEEYFAAKARLFSLLKKNGAAALNIDDPYGARLAKTVDRQVITFGYSAQAALRPLRQHVSMRGIELVLQYGRQELNIQSALIGEYNIQNIMAAAALALASKIEPHAVEAGIKNVKRIPGRLETYPLGNDVLAVIDYAHTPDALQKALQSLRKISTGRLVVLFGAGGDRDRGKRPLMGKIAEQLADRIIVTSDNPRSEDPEKIIAAILSGMSRAHEHEVVTDRKEAIRLAIRSARAGDVILIAGKGHETYQDVKGVKSDFNEAQIIKQAAAHV